KPPSTGRDQEGAMPPPLHSDRAGAARFRLGLTHQAFLSLLIDLAGLFARIGVELGGLFAALLVKVGGGLADALLDGVSRLPEQRILLFGPRQGCPHRRAEREGQR